MDDAGISATVVESRTREVSSIGFPYLGLPDAIEVAKAVYEKAGGGCSLNQLSAYLGHDTTNSGAFRLKLATARTFALLDVNRDFAKLTELGLDIVTQGREKAAAAEAFLKVPLYKAAFDRFRGRQLPPDAALERTFAEMGVAKKQAAKARQAFQRSAEHAGFFESGKDRLVEPAIKTVLLEKPSAMPQTAVQRTDTADIPELIRAMFKQIPPDGAGFPKDRRTKWLQTLENVLELVYGTEDY